MKVDTELPNFEVVSWLRTRITKCLFLSVCVTFAACDTSPFMFIGKSALRR